jgi:hypothetical protein
MILPYEEKEINKRVPLVLIYHPSLEKIAGIVRHHWKEIEKNETLAKLFPEPPVVAFRRPKSFKDTMVTMVKKICVQISTMQEI